VIEHTLNGKHSALELQLIHREPETEAIVIVSVLYDAVKSHNEIIDEFVHDLKLIRIFFF